MAPQRPQPPGGGAPRPLSAGPVGATWSKGGPPPSRSATADDWERAPRLCSLAWAAWLVGMNGSTFRQMMEHDLQLRDRLSYAAPGGGHRWWFTARIWDWVCAPRQPGLHVVGGKDDQEEGGRR